MKFTKENEGAVVYALPTGSYWQTSRNRDNEVLEFNVLKVKRRYVDMQRVGSTRIDSYCQKSGATQSQVNAGISSGYKFFPSLTAIKIHNRYISELKEVRAYFGHYGACSLNHKDVSLINSIIKKSK